MKRSVFGFALFVAGALIAAHSVIAQDLKQKFAAAKEVAANNQKALRSYSWIETVELSLKGEVKNTKVDSCRYGPDGQVQKTPVVEPTAPEKKRGLKGHIIAKKTGEMKEELESAVALVKRYVPPSPDKIQVVTNAGTASISQAGPGAVMLTFPDYEKQGDALKLTFDTAVKALQKIEVATWLDKPDQPVTLNVTMQSLPDGLTYAGVILLSIPESKLDVKIVNSNYQKIAR